MMEGYMWYIIPEKQEVCFSELMDLSSDDLHDIAIGERLPYTSFTSKGARAKIEGVLPIGATIRKLATSKALNR